MPFVLGVNDLYFYASILKNNNIKKIMHLISPTGIEVKLKVIGCKKEEV